jgi:hypothetical protein
MERNGLFGVLSDEGARVCGETSVLSYLTARPSRDLLVAAHQQITDEWWSLVQEDCDLFVSEAVLDEIRAGDPDAAARREAAVADTPVLRLSEQVAELAARYCDELGMPSDRLADLTHVAFAVVHELDYLVTWNCAHIANDTIIRRLVEINDRLGHSTPFLVTPEAFLQLWKGEQQ